MPYIDDKIRQILTERNIDFYEFEHEPVYTSEEAARARGLKSAKQGAKAMVFKTKAGKFILVVNPGDKKVNTRKIAIMENTAHLSLASPGEVEKVAGVPIGCVPPFGLKTRLKTYFNEELLENRFVYFNAGSHKKTVKMEAADLLDVLDGPIRFA